MPYQSAFNTTSNSPPQASSTVSFLSTPWGAYRSQGYLLVHWTYLECTLFFHSPPLSGTNFTPWLGEAHMEFTYCPGMLLGQPTGSTEIQTGVLHIQSPTRYPFGHHVSTFLIVFMTPMSRQFETVSDIVYFNYSHSPLHQFGDKGPTLLMLWKKL